MNDSVKIERHGHVLEITLDRPPVNAIDYQTSCALFEAFALLQRDPELRVGLLAATGERVFCAGWDLKEYADSGAGLVESGDYDLGPGGLGGLSEFFALTKPVIAAVNGQAIGGGFELLLAADLIVASEQASFRLPEISLGFLPDAGGIQRIGKRLPYHLAVDLMLTGRTLDAREARHHGLVCDLVAAADLLPRARALAARVADGAPLAVQAMKEILARIEPLGVEASFALTRGAWRGDGSLPAYERMLHSEDYLEGSRAFSEKRKPVYKGY